MAEFSGRLHRPLQIIQYNTTLYLCHKLPSNHTSKYSLSFTKFIVLFMFTQH